MATANFHARLQRIEQAHARAPEPKNVSFRSPGVAGIATLHRSRKRQRSPIRDHLAAIALGLVLGCLIAVGLVGLSFEGAPWGPGSELQNLVYYPVMGGLALTPILMLMSVFLAARRPGFALFSLGYLSGIVIPLFI